MRTLNQKFDTQSNSTQERDRKFNRRSSSKSLSSRGNRSPSSSISKFWVKDIKPNLSANEIERALSKTMNSESCFNLPTYDECPLRNSYKSSSRESPKEFKKQMEMMKKEIDHYELYTKKQSQTIEELRNDNESLKKQLSLLRERIAGEFPPGLNQENQHRKINDSENVNEGKYKATEKEQKSILKIKLEILQNRVDAYEKEKLSNVKKIEELECSLFECDKKMNEMESQKVIERENILTELRETKNEVQKLQISQGCMQKKFFDEMEALKEKKEKEYESLKRKYCQFLDKYREGIKNNECENRLKGLQKRNNGLSEKEENFFLLSEDEDIDLLH